MSKNSDKSTSKSTSGSLIDFLRDEEFWYILLTLFFFIRNVCYVYSKQGLLLNSDASGEMILADHLNKVGGFLSKDWFYSSELRVLNTQIVYKLGLLFFPHNWHLARTFSVGLFMLFLIAAGWYFMWVLGKKKKGFLFAALLICPFGQWYAWNVIYNSYYVPHIVISLVSVAMFIQLLKTEKKSLRIILIVLSVLLALVAGLGGVRQLMVCYIPLWMSVVILFFTDSGNRVPVPGFKKTVLLKDKEIKADSDDSETDETGEEEKNVESGESTEEDKIKAKKPIYDSRFYMTIIASAILFGSFIGYLINDKVLSNIYSFKDYTETIWMEFNFENIKIVLEQLCRQFGWIPYVRVLGFEGVVNFLSVILMIAMVAAFIILWKKFKALEKEEKILLMYSTVGFAVMLILFAETWVYNESYWIPILPFLFLPLILLIRVEAKGIRSLLFAGAFMLTLVLIALSTGKHPFIIGVPGSEQIQKVAYWLGNEQTEYTKGIAAFWSAPVVTELTDGKIEMWTVEDYDHLEPSTWLQVKEHSKLPEGKVFVLIPCSSADTDPYRKEELKSKVIYNDGEYIVYGLNNYMEYFGGGVSK